MIKVILPYHLQQLAGSGQMVELKLEGEVTLSEVLDNLETRYPSLKGTIRDIHTHKRRDFIRFFACGRIFPWRILLLPCREKWCWGGRNYGSLER